MTIDVIGTLGASSAEIGAELPNGAVSPASISDFAEPDKSDRESYQLTVSAVPIKVTVRLDTRSCVATHAASSSTTTTTTATTTPQPSLPTPTPAPTEAPPQQCPAGTFLNPNDGKCEGLRA